MVGEVRLWLRKWLSVDILAAKIVLLWKSLDNARSDIRTLKDELAVQQEQIINLRKLLESSQSEVKALKDELSATKDSLASLQNSLTISPAKPKIVPKSNRMNWKSFRSAAEKASDPKEPE